MQKRNTGHRTRPAEHSPAERVKRRAAQAARAILAGRGDRAAQWIRVASVLPLLGSRDAYGRWAEALGLGAMPAALLNAAFPPELSPEQSAALAEAPTVNLGDGEESIRGMAGGLLFFMDYDLPEVPA